MKFNITCPRCHSNYGYSIIMELQNDVYHCPSDPTHKFTMDENGFLTLYEP